METDKLPSWAIPLFAFIAGVAVASAMLVPSVITPDYQRGSKDGFRLGFEAGSADAMAMEEVGYQRGLRESRRVSSD